MTEVRKQKTEDREDFRKLSMESFNFVCPAFSILLSLTPETFILASDFRSLHSVLQPLSSVICPLTFLLSDLLTFFFPLPHSHFRIHISVFFPSQPDT